MRRTSIENPIFKENYRKCSPAAVEMVQRFRLHMEGIVAVVKIAGHTVPVADLQVEGGAVIFYHQF